MDMMFSWWDRACGQLKLDRVSELDALTVTRAGIQLAGTQ
jgi:hypothetical protein